MENKTKQSIVMLLSLALMACNTANAPTNNNVGISQLQKNQTKSTLYVLEVSKNKGASFTFNINRPRNGFALKSNTSGKPQKTSADLNHYKIYLLKNASTSGYPNTGDPMGDVFAGPFIISAIGETATEIKFDKIPSSLPDAYYVAVLAQDSSNNNLIEANNDNGSINWSGASAGIPYDRRIAVSSGSGIIVSSDLSVSSPVNMTVTPNLQNGVGATIETNISSTNGVLPNIADIAGTKQIKPIAGPVGSEFQINTYTTSSQQGSSVAMDKNGNYVVVWHSFGSYDTDNDGYSIQGQRYDSLGTPVGTQFQVNSYTFNYQYKPKVAMDSDGDFVVVWQSYGSDSSDFNRYSIHGQRYNSSGTPVGTEFQVNTYTIGDQENPSVSMDSTGNFVVVWESYGGNGTDTDQYSIQGQRYNSSGSAVGTEFQINTYTTNSQRNPSVAMDSAGDFVVVWDSYGSTGNDSYNYSIQGQRYNSSGSTVGTEFQSNTYTTNFQGKPSVAMDSIGDFVIVWESYGSAGTDTDQYSIQGQRYDRMGLPLGTEFQVNTYTNTSQVKPKVAMDSTGDFVVVWNSLSGNGNTDTYYSIEGQRYDRMGFQAGTEFQVNTYTPGRQWTPSVAMDRFGDFVATWYSYGSTGTDTDQYSIQGQRYFK